MGFLGIWFPVLEEGIVCWVGPLYATVLIAGVVNVDVPADTPVDIIADVPTGVIADAPADVIVTKGREFGTVRGLPYSPVVFVCLLERSPNPP